MKKVLKDGTLGISESDRFIAPAEMNIGSDCGGGTESPAGLTGEAEYYFE